MDRAFTLPVRLFAHIPEAAVIRICGEVQGLGFSVECPCSLDSL